MFHLLNNRIILMIVKSLPFDNLIPLLLVSTWFQKITCEVILPLLLNSSLNNFQEQIESHFKKGIWMPLALRRKISDRARNQIILKMACKYCISSEITNCVNYGADVCNTPDETYGHYPIHTVCTQGTDKNCVEVLFRLLDAGAYKNPYTEVSPLTMLCPGIYAKYNIEMLHLLLAYGICVNGTNSVVTPLYTTLKSYNSPSKMTPIINLLLDYNADVDVYDITIAINYNYDDFLILRLIEYEELTRLRVKIK